MGHNINSMFYQGKKPWHGLGKSVEKNLTSADAIAAAGLDWEVKKFPLWTEVNGKMLPVEKKFATVRMDTMDRLGVVGDIYSVLNNKPAFSFFDAIVGLKEAMYHTAGALGKGERIWILAKLPGVVKVTKEDVTEKFLLLTNRHDGGGAVTIMFTPIRVVCQNTLNIAIGADTNRVALRHTTNIGKKVRDAQDQLGIVNQRFQLFEEAAQKLASVKVKSHADLEKFFLECRLIKKDEDGKYSGRAQNIMEEVSALFEKGRGNDLAGVKGSYWAAFNGITEFVDYGRNSDAENRAESLLFGSGANLKQRAWDTALATVK